VLSPRDAGRVAGGHRPDRGLRDRDLSRGPFGAWPAGRPDPQTPGKRRRWALDLRLALIVLCGLGWIAQRSGASLLIAGFGAGLMVAAVGGPKRLSTEVLGVAGGFFLPPFFVFLGAQIGLRGVIQHPAMIGLPETT
jgi:Sodium/hydrogen exchanger family